MLPTDADPETRVPLTPLSFQILLALADGPRHGYGIIKEIEARTHEPLKSSTGTLYLAIQRLEHQGFIDECPPEAGADRRRRYYRLSAFGRSVAAAEAERLATLLGVAHDKHLLSGRSLSALLKAASPARHG